jgi:energy coupling factor transporter S component ThiW
MIRNTKRTQAPATKNKMTIMKMSVLGMLCAMGVVISPVLRVHGMCPMQHFINVVCSVILGPYCSLLNAVMISVLRMSFMGVSVLALTGSVFGALLSGLLYRQFKTFAAAVAGEIIGTGIIGALVSYPAMALLNGTVKAPSITLPLTAGTIAVYVPSFLLGTVIGGTFAYTFLRILNKNGLLQKFMRQVNGTGKTPSAAENENNAG